MGDRCRDRVVIITGAGRGIGRAEALGFASEGAKLVITDIGVELDGTGGSAAVGAAVVEEIKALGADAVLSTEDVGDSTGAKAIFDLALETYGRLDVIVNNAGILRDRMIFNMSEEDFDAVIRVHLKGAFNLNRLGAIYWRERSREGIENDARIINTTSPSGLYGSAGQQNYAAAKAGIAAATIGLSRELQRYGVTVNAISPVARTRMSATLDDPNWKPEGGPNLRDPENVAPFVAWLGSTASRDITGQVFEIGGGRLTVAEGWRRGPTVERETAFDPDEFDTLVPELVAQSVPGRVPGRPRPQ